MNERPTSAPVLSLVADTTATQNEWTAIITQSTPAGEVTYLSNGPKVAPVADATVARALRLLADGGLFPEVSPMLRSA